MNEFMSIGSRSGTADLGRGSAAITPGQARKLQEHMIRSLGNRKCQHKAAIISKLEGGGFQMDCPGCDLRACADEATALRLGWIQSGRMK